jgi:hypothetical protein
VDESYTSTFAADRVSQQFWGARYIDDAVAKRLDNNADGDYLDTAGTADSAWYYLTDSQFSVRQVVDEFGDLYERLDYTPYGEPRHSYAADVWSAL